MDEHVVVSRVGLLGLASGRFLRRLVVGLLEKRWI